MDGGVELEDLEPLFDYSSVQPVDDAVLLDDDDSLEGYSFRDNGKKNKRKGDSSGTAKGKKGNERLVVVDLDGDGDNVDRKMEKEDEEDWLPSPPKKFIDLPLKSEVDETIRELRLKKMELAFAMSPDIILNEVIENARKEIINSKSVAESATEQSKPHVERPKIVIAIQDKEMSKQFRVNKDDTLDRLFKTYAERAKVKFESLVFCFDGDKISSGATPNSLGMDDDDMIEVYAKSH